MTPKSLLRLPAAASSLDQLTSGGFQPIIDDNEVGDPASVERIVLCSGKVFYDLKQTRSSVSEPRADRGPRAGSPRGVGDATGSIEGTKTKKLPGERKNYTNTWSGRKSWSVKLCPKSRVL